MSSLLTAQCQSLCDSLSYSLILLQSGMVLGPASTISAITGGLATASPSTMGQILALDDAGLELLLLPAQQQVASVMSNQLLTATQLAGYYPAYAPMCSAIDLGVQSPGISGLAAFCVATGLQLHQHFAAAFNAFAAQAVTGNYRPAGNPVAALGAGQIFLATAQTLGSLIASVFTPGAVINGASFAPAPLRVTATGTGSHTPTLSITYVPSLGGAQQVWSGAAPAVGSSLSTGVNGLAVVTMSTTGTTDATALYTVSGQPARTITSF